MKNLRSNFLYTKNQAYSTKYFMYQYNSDSFRIVLNKYTKGKGFEDTRNKKEIFIPQTDSEELQRQSLSRTKRNIREIALCNDFTHFATLTVNSEKCDRFSLTECQQTMKKKLKKIKRTNKDFAYIFITEKHKDGAFHFHGLVKGLPLYVNDNGYFSNNVFDELGFNSFSKIRDFNKTCNYITKYITKDCVKNENNQIYISSRGLKKAVKYEIEPINVDWSYVNDFCCIRDFNVNEMSQEELLNFMTISQKTFFKSLDK